ncbi:MAG: o-succinylbenzoate synthase [Candidatus Hydrogenedentales bacterium]
MLNVQNIILREIRLPLVEPFQISSGVEHERRILLVEVHDTHGAFGWGECVAGAGPNYAPETIDTAWIMIRDWVAPRVLGKEIEHPSQVHALLERNFRGHNMAKAAVEMALWDLYAQIAGVSLAELLGGTRDVIATGISLGIQDSPETLARKAAAARAEGYRKIKVKIRPGEDVQYVRAVVGELGDTSIVMADANSAYTLDDTEHLQKLDALGLLMIEQPLAWDDLRRHAELQKHLRTPLCLDESITSLDRAEDMIALQSGRIINIKAGRVGGHTASIAIHDLCAANDIPVWCGGMLESGIGRAHNVALASLPNFTLPGDVSPSARYWAEDIVEPEWTMDKEGFVTVPRDFPGIGVEVNTKRVEALTVRCENVRTM